MLKNKTRYDTYSVLLIFNFEYGRSLVMMILITCFGGCIFFTEKTIMSRTPTFRFLSEKVGKNPRLQVVASNRGFTVVIIIIATTIIIIQNFVVLIVIMICHIVIVIVVVIVTAEFSYKKKTVLIAMTSVVTVSVITVLAFLLFRLYCSRRHLAAGASDAALPALVRPLDAPEFDIEKVALVAPLSHGRFGDVWRGSLGGADVAVKVRHSQIQCTHERVSAPL